MSRQEISAKIAEDSKLTARQVDQVLKSFMELATEELKAGNPIQLVGFGTIAPVERAAKAGRNPQTGEAITIPAKKSAKFKAGAALKKALNA